MNRRLLALRPFENSLISADFTLTGVVERSNEMLIIDYSLVGPLGKLLIPPQVKAPMRKGRLWEETCFECFIGMDDTTRYWEINLSPAGHWNIYQFEDYRFGMKEASGCCVLPSISEVAADRFKIRCTVDLNALGLATTGIRVGLSAILKTTDSKVQHWAIVHPGPVADFHRRDGFVVNL